MAAYFGAHERFTLSILLYWLDCGVAAYATPATRFSTTLCTTQYHYRLHCLPMGDYIATPTSADTFCTQYFYLAGAPDDAYRYKYARSLHLATHLYSHHCWEYKRPHSKEKYALDAPPT